MTVRGGRSIQARQLVFQSYYHLLAHEFSNGSSLRPSWGRTCRASYPRRLPNKGRYGCAASAKPRPGKISPNNLMPGQRSAQKPNDRTSFHEL